MMMLGDVLIEISNFLFLQTATCVLKSLYQKALPVGKHTLNKTTNGFTCHQQDSTLSLAIFVKLVGYV
jgi:hypothetical protein